MFPSSGPVFSQPLSLCSARSPYNNKTVSCLPGKCTRCFSRPNKFPYARPSHTVVNVVFAARLRHELQGAIMGNPIRGLRHVRLGQVQLAECPHRARRSKACRNTQVLRVAFTHRKVTRDRRVPVPRVQLEAEGLVHDLCRLFCPSTRLHPRTLAQAVRLNDSGSRA